MDLAAAGHSILSAEVNFGSDLTSLVPTIEIDANSTVSPASGLTNDFTAPKIYTVTAQDGVTFEKYLVTVTEAEDPGIEADSLVLIDLYNSTDGANWVDPWNLEQPKTTWTGFTRTRPAPWPTAATAWVWELRSWTFSRQKPIRHHPCDNR